MRTKNSSIQEKEFKPTTVAADSEKPTVKSDTTDDRGVRHVAPTSIKEEQPMALVITSLLGRCPMNKQAKGIANFLIKYIDCMTFSSLEGTQGVRLGLMLQDGFWLEDVAGTEITEGLSLVQRLVANEKECLRVVDALKRCVIRNRIKVTVTPIEATQEEKIEYRFATEAEMI